MQRSVKRLPRSLFNIQAVVQHHQGYKFSISQIAQVRGIIESDSSQHLLKGFSTRSAMEESKSATDFKFAPYSSKRKATFNPEGFPYPKATLASYPRSGNSMFRNVLEQASGLFTGSDREKDGQLFEAGLEGEEVVDDSVWIVKTHFPISTQKLPYSAERVVLLVRNPFDSIDSFFHLGLSGNHNTTIERDENEEIQTCWRGCVDDSSTQWAVFHKFWLSTGLPTLVIRYEDFLEAPREKAQLTFKFLLGDEEYERSGIKENVDAYYDDQERKTTAYKPRSGGVFKSLPRYAEEHIKTVLKNAGTEMQQLGYLRKEFLARGSFSVDINEFCREGGVVEEILNPEVNKAEPKKYVKVNDPETHAMPEEEYFFKIQAVAKKLGISNGE